MKALTKVLVSRQAKNPKSVQIEDLFFTKKEMFSKEDIKEIKGKMAEMPSLTDGRKYSHEHLSHLFDHVTGRVKTFMFMLTCLRDEEGAALFRLDQATGKAYIYCTKPGADVSEEDKVEPAVEEEAEDTTDAPTEEGDKGGEGAGEGDDKGEGEEGSEEGDDKGEGEEGAGEGDEGSEGAGEGDEGSEGAGEGDDKGEGEEGSEEGDGKAEVNISEALANNFKVDELRDFLTENTDTTKTAAKKLKEAELCTAIVEGVAEDKIQEFIDSKSEGGEE